MTSACRRTIGNGGTSQLQANGRDDVRLNVITTAAHGTTVLWAIVRLLPRIRHQFGVDGSTDEYRTIQSDDSRSGARKNVSQQIGAV
jgi:hypothetical protein